MEIDASEERLSKYELIRPLGSGGMGEVYLARDRVLQRQVAIKFVSSTRLNEPGAERRLVREARAAAALDHPAICPVYDVLGADDRTCIVMQYVDGETLAARLKRGPLDPSDAVALALRIAEALAAAHAAGIVHRDLKPQNIVLMPDGRPKLLDFGIAQKQLPPEVVASIETHTATETSRSNAIVGTPAYMSPEQVLRKPLDGRSDLFSLGAVLSECLTGEPAFLAGTDVETWARVVYATPPAPSSLNRAVPAELDAVVAKLLAKSPSERYASAADAVGALRELGVTTEHALSRRHLVLAVAAVVGAIALTGLGAWAIMRPRALPAAPPEAAQWYQRGTGQLRDGAYSSAKRALQKAIDLHSDYPQALARLAEVEIALDEERDAGRSVLRILEMVRDPSRVAGIDGIRLRAVQALAVPDFAKAVAAYQQIADLNRADPGSWLDLARANRAADRRPEALAAVDTALRLDPQFAPAHLWRGLICVDLRRGDEALKELTEAEHLYWTASNAEGQTEALLGRAQFLANRGDLVQAQAIVDTATQLAAQTGSQSQQIRAAMLRADITALMGDFEGARHLATGAIDMARRNQLDTVAARGLIDLGTALMFSRDTRGAEAQLKESIDASERLGAKQVKLRATLQLAALYLTISQPRDSVALTEGMLDYIRRAQVMTFEMRALGILAQAKTDLHAYDDARRYAEQALALGKALGDQSGTAPALEALAYQATLFGAYPEALGYRQRQEDLHRAQKQNTALAFDLWNRADLLLRLGRFEDAESPLSEMESRIKAGVGVFVQRSRRTTLLRAYSAAERRQFAELETLCGTLLDVPSAPVDAVTPIAAALRVYARDQMGRGRRDPVAIPKTPDPDVPYELRYWTGVAMLGRGDADGARVQADALLDVVKKIPSPELEWRAAALGAAAAVRRHDASRTDEYARRASGSLDRLRTLWKQDSAIYERRPDLVELKREAGLK